jgi:triacylglycerol lipase
MTHSRLVSRRTALKIGTGTALLPLLHIHSAGAADTSASTGGQPPILFVHGAGDSAVQFDTVLWRFESNGWNPKRLFTINFTHPAPLLDIDKPDPNRSTTGQQRTELAARVAEVLRDTGEQKLILIALSRGGNTVRDYIKNGNGAGYVSIAILCASPNHGARGTPADPGFNSEFKVGGPFIGQLNEGPVEATPGVRWLTLRSDTNDYAFQPTRIRWGHPEQPSNLRYDSPELTGATNIMLPGLSHIGVLTDPQAFREMYRFITDHEPAHLDIVPEPTPVLDGMITQMAGDVELNLPLAGASLEIFEVSPSTGERQGPPVHKKVTGADGLWGPFSAKPDAYYEFVMTAQGYAISHIYWTPFPRSSSVLHLRPATLTDEDKAAGSTIVLFRPNGRLGLGHVTALIDGAPAPGLKEGPPIVDKAALWLPFGEMRAVPVVLNAEQLSVRSWPTSGNNLVIARFRY